VSAYSNFNVIILLFLRLLVSDVPEMRLSGVQLSSYLITYKYLKIICDFWLASA